MRRSLTLVLVVALAALVFAPAAFAQDDNPSRDDLGEARGFDDNPTGDDVVASASASPVADDNPTGDDAGASPASSAAAAASATPTATSGASSSASADTGELPETGGAPLLAVAAGVLLVGGGVLAATRLRRTS